MRRLTESERQELTMQTVRVLDDARKAFLANGGSPLKQWDQLQARATSAGRRTTTPEEWVTELYRGLQLGPPSGGKMGNSASSAIRELAETVSRWDCAAEWLDLLAREITFFIATARVAVDQKRADREAANGILAVEMARTQHDEKTAE